MKEVFDSAIGPITVSTESYCKNCDEFKPYIMRCVMRDGDGKAMHSENGRLLYDGVDIFCEHHHLCAHVAKDVGQRIEIDKEPT